MGQSVLFVHHVDGRKYSPYGYFGRTVEGESFVTPEVGETRVRAFADAFRLMRGNEPGLSIVIPYPKPDIRPAEILQSVVRHYFFPILSGKLVVTVSDADNGQEIDADSIEGMAANQPSEFSSIMRPVLLLARWAIREGRTSAMALFEPGDGWTPKWTDYPIDPATLKLLRNALRAGGRIAVKVPIWVKPVAGEMQHSFFHVYMEANLTNNRQRPLFVRTGVTITDAVKDREGASARSSLLMTILWPSF